MYSMMAIDNNALNTRNLLIEKISCALIKGTNKKAIK